MSKGQISDLFFLGPILIIGIITIIFAFVLTGEIKSELENDPSTNSPDAIIHLTRGQNFFSNFDTIILFIAIGAGIAMMASAYFIESSPIFFIVSLLVFILAVGIGSFSEQIFEDIKSDPSVSEAISTNFKISDWLFSRWALVLAVFGTGTLIALHSKNGGSYA